MVGKRSVPFVSPQRSESVASPALSPLRHGALRSTSKYPLCRGEGCQAPTFLIRSGLSPRNATSLQAIFFGLLFFWASKRKVTRPSAEGRNARCVSGQVAERQQPKAQSKVTGFLPSQE